jgi:cytochrome c
MSKYLSIGAAGGTAALLGLAFTAAGSFVTPIPDVPIRAPIEVPAQAAIVNASATVEPETPAVTTPVAPVETVTLAKLGLGRAALPEEVAAWNLDVRPDGLGLPEGQGDALTGEPIFEENCASCHGSFAEGVDNWPKLAGGNDTLDRDDPLKTVGSYWPHLSTVWDYVHRSMPFGNAQTLSPDDVYAITAYILYSNDLIEDDFVLSKDSFLEVEMPNADGFILDDRAETEYAVWSGEPCMSDCKDKVEVTMRARVLDVTPQEEGADPAPVAEITPAEETIVTTIAKAVVEAKPDPVTAPVVEPVSEPVSEAVDVVAADPALIAAGEKVFKKCSACHQVGEGAVNKTGPHLNGIMGRVAGTGDGFKYSKVFGQFADEGLVWTEETLSEFLTDPKAYAKGTRMSFRGLNKPDDLKAVAAYLESFTE